MVANATVITLLWMRHGLSCSNVLDGCTGDQATVDALATPAFYDALDGQLAASSTARARRRHVRRGSARARVAGARADCGIILEGGGGAPAEARLHDLYRDPKLTDCGVAASTYAGAALRGAVGDVDLVLSSTLRRARETAAAAFPGRAVREVPFIAERPFSSAAAPAVQLDNEPGPTAPAGSLVAAGDRGASDWARFLGVLGSSLLDDLAGGTRPAPAAVVGGPDFDGGAASNFTVFMVGHGDMMKHVCGRGTKPANNAVLGTRVLVDEAGVVRAAVPAACELVLDAPPQVELSLTAADVARCDDPWDVGPFLDLAPAGGNARSCAAAARAAFPAARGQPRDL